MSHVAMRNSEQAAVAASSKIKSMGRLLTMMTAMCLGLTACETMKNTMDSINIFDEGEKPASSAAASSSTDVAADPRKHAVMNAGVEAVDPETAGEYMDQQEAILRERLAGSGVTITRVGETIVLSMPGSETFASGSSKVQSKFVPVLDSVVVVLDEFDKTYVDIIGHTDSKGSKAYNKRLSEQRAESVARYFESRAVTRARVLVDGMGEAEPIASNDTREGRAKNRRLEIKLKPVT
jgi:outer membrane protein OmpA-like peptidoglycan-associated protein